MRHDKDNYVVDFAAIIMSPCQWCSQRCRYLRPYWKCLSLTSIQPI